MSPANEEILDVMRYVATVRAYVETSIFIDPTLVGAQDFEIYRSKLLSG